MRTQWATKEKHLALERAAVVSDRFELSRNFCNKLWNASRFALMNLEGYESGSVADDELAIDDRWILSRLATVTEQVTEGLERYQFADAARTLYGFAWDEFCSFYLEMIKHRLQDTAARPVAQRVLAHTLDTLLRLLHPMIPFITEEVWQLLGGVAAERGIDAPTTAAKSVMIAPWPQSDAARRDAQIEQQFALFQAVLGGIREIRTRQNIAPREQIEFLVNCDAATAALLEPMQPAFAAMARAKATGWGESVEAPATSASFRFQGLEVMVDLSGLIDVEAEFARLEKAHADLLGQIAGKEKKLANDAFLSRAPAEVVQKERDRLAELGREAAAVAENLGKLRGGAS
jgi:valyl-tRNA synthetase